LAAGLVDSHCHLDFIEGDTDGLVASARQAGLVGIINPGTSLKTSQAAVALAERHAMVYAAVGVHPHDASTFDHETVAALRELAAHPKVVAIGETGLDYYRNYSPHDAQQRAFEAQLELAAELGLPVIIHNRDATEDTFARLRDWSSVTNGRRGVLHSYSAGPEWLEQAMSLGFFIGISGPVTYPKAGQLQQVAQEVPLDRLLVETDAPFLTPVPFRGRRNQPAYVQYVAEKIAALRHVPVEQLGQQTTQNVIRLFGQIGTTLE
jgi:TatD DNase family protein